MSGAATLAVIFGGRSVEHEVSLVSGRTVARAAAEAGFRTVPVLVDRDGRWYTGDLDDLSRAERGGPPAARVLPPSDPTEPWLREPGGGTASPPLEAAFPVVHGRGGEDGNLQALLEEAAVPYVGAGVLASALCMDKDASKRLLRASGVPVVDWERVTCGEWEASREAALDRAAALGPTLFVKPASGGSSVGVRRAASREDLAAALDHALGLDVKAVVEPSVDAREIECAVLGNESPEAAPPGEILPGRDFYDYEAKYGDAGSRVVLPADLAPVEAEAVRENALRAYRALGVEGMARVDFLLERGGGRLFVNELNTLPGFTPISLYPKAWALAGLPLPGLVRRLVDLALARAGERARLRTRWRPED